MPFSPTSTQYLVGTPNRVLDEFVRRRVLGVHDFSGSAEKAKYRKIMTF